MNRNALVTGANRGIGRAIALRLAREGYSVFLLARDEVALTEVADECARAGAEHGIKVGTLAGHLPDAAYVDRAVAAAVDAAGPIGVLINNAGVARHQAAQSADANAWRELFEVNFHSAVYLCSQILPGMIDREAGAVINISSINARSTSAGVAAYSASKHALNAFTECMYEDVRDFGIKVSAILPGFVATELTEGMALNSDHMIQASDVADAVYYVISSSANVCPTEIVLRPQRRP